MLAFQIIIPHRARVLRLDPEIAYIVGIGVGLRSLAQARHPISLVVHVGLQDDIRSVQFLDAIAIGIVNVFEEQNVNQLVALDLSQLVVGVVDVEDRSGGVNY